MSDLTESQYLKLKPFYWSKRFGPEELDAERLIWAIQFSTKKPKEHHHVWPAFYEWNDDLTYGELNDHNRRLCTNLC